MALAYLRFGHTYAQLAVGFSISTTTAYRYVAEAVDVSWPLSHPPSPRR